MGTPVDDCGRSKLVPKPGLQTKGEERTALLQKNVIVAFVLQGGTSLLSIYLVRLSLEYLGKQDYGIWVTIGSVITWFQVFEIGLTDGLRNRLSVCLAQNDFEYGRKYLSTTYALMTILSVGLFILLAFGAWLVDWGVILGAPMEMSDLLRDVALLLLGTFCLRTTVNIITTVYSADQRPAFNSVLTFLSTLVSTVATYVALRLSDGSLVIMSLISGMPLIILSLALTLYAYNSRYLKMAPSLKFVDWKLSPDILSLSGRFFLLQIAAIILFTTQNVIITQLFGPEEVTPYNIAFRYFVIVGIIFRIAYGPIWSAVTHAYSTADLDWIRKTIRKAIYVWIATIPVVMSLIIFSESLYRIWIADQVQVPIPLTILMGIFTLQSGWNNIFSFFLNGISKIRLQLTLSFSAALINIPLSIILARDFDMGTGGVILATILCLFPATVMQPIQYLRIMKGQARGIYNK